MAFLNVYRKISLSSVAESQSSCIFLAMDLVVGPELRHELGLLLSLSTTYHLYNQNLTTMLVHFSNYLIFFLYLS